MCWVYTVEDSPHTYGKCTAVGFPKNQCGFFYPNSNNPQQCHFRSFGDCEHEGAIADRLLEERLESI